MKMFRAARVAGAVLFSLGLVSISGCEDGTGSTPTGTVEVTNTGTVTLDHVTLTSGSGSQTVQNVAAGKKATFPHVAHGTCTAVGYNATGNQVVSVSGTLTSSVLILNLDW